MTPWVLKGRAPSKVLTRSSRGIPLSRLEVLGIVGTGHEQLELEEPEDPELADGVAAAAVMAMMAAMGIVKRIVPVVDCWLLVWLWRWVGADLLLWRFEDEILDVRSEVSGEMTGRRCEKSINCSRGS